MAPVSQLPVDHYVARPGVIVRGHSRHYVRFGGDIYQIAPVTELGVN